MEYQKLLLPARKSKRAFFLQKVKWKTPTNLATHIVEYVHKTPRQSFTDMCAHTWAELRHSRTWKGYNITLMLSPGGSTDTDNKPFVATCMSHSPENNKLNFRRDGCNAFCLNIQTEAVDCWVTFWLHVSGTARCVGHSIHTVVVSFFKLCFSCEIVVLFLDVDWWIK